MQRAVRAQEMRDTEIQNKKQYAEKVQMRKQEKEVYKYLQQQLQKHVKVLWDYLINYIN